MPAGSQICDYQFVSLRRGSQPVQHDFQDIGVERMEKEGEGAAFWVGKLRSVRMDDASFLSPADGKISLSHTAQFG